MEYWVLSLSLGSNIRYAAACAVVQAFEAIWADGIVKIRSDRFDLIVWPGEDVRESSARKPRRDLGLDLLGPTHRRDPGT
jgi:hypothetical protein